MSAGDAPRVELPPEFRSALEKLHRLFAGALHDAKFNSCWAAWTDIRRTKSAKKKIELLNKDSSSGERVALTLSANGCPSLWTWPPPIPKLSTMIPFIGLKTAFGKRLKECAVSNEAQKANHYQLIAKLTI